MLTKEIRDLIGQGLGDTALATALSNDRVRVTRHQARKYIEEHKAEQLAGAAKPKPSNNYEAASREEWFMRSQAAIEDKFAKAGYPLPPKIRIGCGFPSGGKRSHALGECWKSDVSGDETYEIFINPRMNTAKPGAGMVDKASPMHMDGDLIVLGTVWHELVHAALWHAGEEKHGHGPVFKKLAGDLGMEVKNKKGGTALTTAAQIWAKTVLDEIGPYPMAAMSTGVSVKKTQTTRQLLLTDPANPEYKVRMPREPITKHGLPKSPDGADMVIDPLSALRTKYTKEELEAHGLVVGDELTDRGHQAADELIREIIDGKDVAT